ncbi:MAG: hypothetical protein CSA58_03565 [Micrococcales bacterium]|nr:MAG: hypothetical protein CSA58_03565 [Micrococcales bacterium]
MAANSDTELYLTAVHTLTPGTTVQEADLRSVHVNLGDAAERYLPATQVPPAGSIVVQTVREGELLPTQALGSAEDVRLRPLNLPVTGGSAEGMRPGDVVDIWVSVADSSAPGAYEQPEAVVESAIVRQIKADAARFGGGSSSTITVLVPQESVPGLLAAVANDAQIALVPVVGQQS